MECVPGFLITCNPQHHAAVLGRAWIAGVTHVIITATTPQDHEHALKIINTFKPHFPAGTSASTGPTSSASAAAATESKEDAANKVSGAPSAPPSTWPAGPLVSPFLTTTIGVHPTNVTLLAEAEESTYVSRAHRACILASLVS